MSESTPLQKLDDAVHEYFATLDDPGSVSGWVLAFQSQKLEVSEGHLPLLFRSDFTMSAGTSPETAMGLMELSARRIEHHVLWHGDDEDDE